MRAPAVLLLLVLLGGCTTPPAAPAPPEPAGPLALSEPVRVEGRLTREPAIVEAADGTLFVAGYAYGTSVLGMDELLRPDLASPPVLWRSIDHGATWTPVDVGTVADGAVGNSDVDLAVGPDGTLYFASMSFTRLGHTIAVGASHDTGATWTWSLLAAVPFVDRPWVAVAPDGTAHVVWNDGQVVHQATSRDGGRGWTEGRAVHDPGGDGGLAISPRGDVAVRIIPSSASGYRTWPGQDGVAVADAGSDAWEFRPVPGTRDYGNDTPFRWADPVAFDADGTLLTAWGEGSVLFLARSSDLGRSWDVRALASGADKAVYPHLRAGSAVGELVATWFTLPASGDPIGHVALVRGAHGPAATLREAAFPTSAAGGTGGEYFQATFLRGGGIGFATPIQTADRTGAQGFAYRVAR